MSPAKTDERTEMLSVVWTREGPGIMDLPTRRVTFGDDTGILLGGRYNSDSQGGSTVLWQLIIIIIIIIIITSKQ